MRDDTAPFVDVDDAYYRELRDMLKSRDCFRPTHWIVAIKIAVLLLVIVAGYLLLLAQPGWPTRILALVSLACSHAQCGFMAHDAFHRTVGRTAKRSDILGQALLSFTTGLSYSYFFKHNHRAHHVRCGREADDPEMQSDLLALYPDAATEKSGTAQWISRHQSWLIWPLLSLNTFSLRLSGLGYIGRNPKTTRGDQAAVILHALAWLGVPAFALGPWPAILNYVLLTWFTGIYLAGIFPFYHVGRRTLPDGAALSFFRQQVEATRNMSASWLTELYTGGTNNHIEHHLFPGIPSARLRRARRITREFCRQRGIDYREQSYTGALREITIHLRRLQRHLPSVAK